MKVEEDSEEQKEMENKEESEEQVEIMVKEEDVFEQQVETKKAKSCFQKNVRESLLSLGKASP